MIAAFVTIVFAVLWGLVWYERGYRQGRRDRDL